jgi:DNA-binding NarL/FixJ family response regulator
LLPSPNLGRVLVVDDHEQWRRQLSSLVEQTGQWQITGEAVDGLDAIAKAAAVQPDLILLDVELPLMNGLEAARRIRAAEPAARILFISGHREPDIIAAAMSTGACGYILKTNVAHDLLPAMAAIRDGERFISAALAGREA